MSPSDFNYDSTHTVPITDLMPNPWNPHRMTPEEQDELMQSVQEGGQWRPILVVAMDVPDEASPDSPPVAPFRIVDGEHLYRALSALHLAGLIENEARVMVLGLNSEVPVWRQKEIGQTINHGLRGSLEDAEKTRDLVRDLLDYRPEATVAKRMSIGIAAVRHLAGLPSTSTPHRVGGSASVPTVKNSVQPRNVERKSTTIALVFDDGQEMQTFEQSLTRVGKQLGVYRDQYKGRAGRFRIELLQQLLDKFEDGLDEEA